MAQFESDPENGKFIFHTETFYDQLDGQMLLHHPRYLVFLERAQQSWIEQVLEAPRFDWQNFPDLYLVVRKLEIEYLHSVDGVRDLSVHLWCGGVRAAKMSTCFEIRSRDGETLFARGERTNCKVSPQTHEPVIWSDLFLERFGKLAEVARASGTGRT